MLSPFVDSPASPGPLQGHGPGRAAGDRADGQAVALTVTVHGVLSLARRRCRLILSVALVTAVSVGVFVLIQAPIYRSRAAIRLADSERPVAVGMETPLAPKDRTINPVLILVELLRRRSVIGQVVDSLSLRVQPVSSRLLGLAPLSPTGLLDVRLAPDSPTDTIVLEFVPDSVSLRTRHGRIMGAYGRPMTLGGLQVTVRRRPPVARAAFVLVPRERTIDNVLEHLAVAPRKATDIVDVAYSTPDPVLAQRLSNEVIAAFRTSQARALRAQAQRSAEFLDGQRTRIADLQKAAQEELAVFQKTRRTGARSGNLDSRQGDLATLDMRLSELDADRRVYLALLQRLDAGTESERLAAVGELAYSPELANDRVIEKLYPLVLQYRVRLDSMTSGPHAVAPGNPDRIQLASLVRSTHEELVRAARAHLASTQSRRAALLAIRARARAAARDAPALDAEETRLQHRLDLLVTATDQLQLEYQKARLAYDLAAGDVRIVDEAPLPYRAEGLSDGGKILLGLFLGLLLGMGTAVVLDATSRVIHRPEEVERLLPVRRLGVIPPIEEEPGPDARRRGPLHLGHRTRAPREPGDLLLPSTHAFRRVYSNLVPGWGAGRRTILVTSTMPLEGKTLTAASLARIFAGEGARVLLIDCDVHRPCLHQLFHVARAPGLMEVFVDRPPPAPVSYSFAPEVSRGPPVQPPDPLEEAIQPTSVPKLFVLAAGARPGSAADLKGTRMRDLLDGLGDRFDLIILDAPPVLASTDPAILAPLVDGVILLVRAAQTEREAIGHAYEQLRGAGGHVLGVVLNDPAGEIPKYDRFYHVYDAAAVEVS